MTRFAPSRFLWRSAALLPALLGMSAAANAEDVLVLSVFAEVRDDDRVLLRPEIGQTLTLVKTQKQWAQVSFPDGESTRKGWIKLAHLVRTEKLTPEQGTILNAAFADQRAAQAGAAQGDLDTFIAKGLQALVSYRQVLGKGHMHVARVADGVAVACHEQGDLKRAEPLYQEALGIYKTVLGEKHLEYAAQIDRLAQLHLDADDLARAEPLLKECLAIRAASLGTRNRDYASSLNSLGQLYMTRGDYAQAEPLLIQCVRIVKEVLKADDPAYAACLNSLGMLYREMCDSVQAEPLLRECIERNKAAPGERSLPYAMSLGNLGGLYREMGDAARAEALLSENVRLIKEIAGADRPEYATSLNNLALLYKDLGDYARAGAMLRECVEVYKQSSGTRDLRYASSVGNLGALYEDIGDFARAEPLYLESLELTRQTVGEESSTYATSLNNLAGLYVAQQDFARAEPLFLKSLEIKKKRLGEQHPNYAVSLSNLANLYTDLGDFDRAEPLYRQSLAIRKEVASGKDHADYAIALNNLALLRKRRGEGAHAVPLLRETARIIRDTLGEQHPRYAIALGNLGETLGQQENWTETIATLDLARRAVRSHVVDVLPGLSEREQTVYLATYERSLGVALSVAARRPSDAAAIRATAQWALNGKAVAHETRARSALLGRRTDDPEAAELAQRVRSSERRLASLVMRTTEPAAAKEKAAELQRLSAQREELLAKLGQRLGQSYQAPDWVGFEDVQSRVPEGAALVEIARYPEYDFQNDVSRGERYAAWVIDSIDTEQPRFVDLGPAQEIDAAIANARRALLDSAATISNRGDELATRAALDALRPLASLVLEPLRSQLGDRRTLILSPDSNLWLVPWSALPLEDGRLAIEDYTLRFVVCGRDLTSPTADIPSGPGLVIADPDFGLSTEKVAARAAELNAAAGAAVVKRSSTALGAAQFGPLPDTRVEARAIAPALEAWSGQPPRVLLGEEAIEAAARQASNPRVLVLSTHGYFLPLQEEKSNGRALLNVTDRPAAALSADGQPLENPLLRCGLVFAGANTRNQRTDDTADDGLLTGLEIVGMDLRGTELVVLSACETGLGDVRNGEGVAGLRQAFQLAGAEAVVATLWQIPDKDTAIIMGDFFANLAAGQSKAEALRNAQLKRVADRRTRNGAAHPLFWAAFTLTGD